MCVKNVFIKSFGTFEFHYFMWSQLIAFSLVFMFIFISNVSNYLFIFAFASIFNRKNIIQSFIFISIKWYLLYLSNFWHASIVFLNGIFKKFIKYLNEAL